MASLQRVMVAAVVLLCGSYSGAAQHEAAGSDARPLPTLDELAKARYEPAAAPRSPLSPTKQEIAEAVHLAESFARGAKLVTRYREPERTRGASGVNVFRRAAPSVVFIYSANASEEKSEAGQGTGVLVDARGLVLTNWHVVEGFDRVVVFLKPERGATLQKNRAYLARLVTADQLKDMALLRIAEPPPDLPAAPLADAALVEVGQDIHVIGHPGGAEQAWSYTTGVVSQIRKNYRAEFEGSSPIQANLLQIQTAVNPGNSGGPVLDDAGRIVGLVSFRRPSMQNVSFAIASDEIAGFLSEWQKARPRGMDAVPPWAEAQAKFSRGALSGSQGMKVLKVEYAGLTVYVVEDAAGQPTAFVAQTEAGAVVTCASPSLDGAWEVRLPGGTAVRILRRNGEAYASEFR